MVLRRFVSAVLLAAAVSGCSSVPRIVNEYKIDVQQGNVVTQEMVSQLKPGLTKDQVRFVLGSPVLMDMFHGNRWDYVYRMQKGTGEVEMRKFSTFFDEGGRLVRVDGDVTAAKQASDLTAAQETRTREIDLGSVPADTVAPPVEEKGFIGKLFEFMGL